METKDPERKRIRLAELYSRMGDCALQELAEDTASLTDPACLALMDELARRGMHLD